MSQKKRTSELEPDASASFCRACISVVIPARNEAARIGRLIARLKAMPEVGEIIVSDGQSDDETAAIARDLGAVVIECPPSRGGQQNAGAARARGEILWFLHADALPDARSGRQIARAVRGGALGGNFRVRFAARGFWPRAFELIARGQRRFGIYYGDSGIWATRAAWGNLGPFAAWPLFEDLDFARRLENAPGKTACCAGRLRVSARRFQKSPLRVLVLWLGLQIGFELGVSPRVLARIYFGRAPK